MQDVKITSINGKGFLRFEPNKAILIDVRPEYELARFFDVPNLLYASYLDIEQWIGKLPKDKTLVIADATGIRSKEVARLMQVKGFSTVYLLAGGLVDWERAGLPVTVDKKRTLSGSCMCQLRPRNK
jgi:rhodanese-related sulfurtransferase